MELYHYRSIDTALKEISNGTFHYSDKSELNDPIEGYVQIYWQADKPAWEGLLRNYVCSLYHSIHLYLLAANYEDIEKNAVLWDIHCFDNVPMGKSLKETADNFVKNHYVQKIIQCVGMQNIKCSVKSLRSLLHIIHEVAFSLCIQSLKKEKVIPNEQEDVTIHLEKILDKLPKNIYEQINTAEFEVFLTASSEIIEDILESRLIANKQDESRKLTQWQTWLKLRLDFPAIYTDQLQNIIYPKAYIVCFSSDNTNSAMWGNYADNHRGVCLIYQTSNINGQEVLSVKSCISSNENRISFSFRQDNVIPVKYDSPLIQRNFFESLGQLTYPQALSWLVNHTGEASKFLKNYSDEKWRLKYWDDCKEKYCLKLSDWKHEQEYRLLLIEFLHKYTAEERMIKYAPDNLIGVVWGINTSLYDKSAIKDTGRNLDNFKFYQAEYDDKNQHIVIRKKSMFLR